MRTYCYHFTKIKNLKSILEKGLIPMNGENSQLVGDSRTGVYASLGIEGALVFSARFWYKMMYLYNDKSIARKKFDETIFLRFEIDHINPEEIIIENFSQYFFTTSIEPKELKVCFLKDQNGVIEIDRFKIMLYIMKMVHFPNQMNLKNFPYKALVKKLYEDLQEDLATFPEQNYQLDEIPLSDFINQDLSFSAKR